ncbi:OmpA family protein, partial [Fusobacterium sp. PH5-44]|uniref:OmpA family protein n=1 Tax=unclassified Fusobacterium TaxID=2648384 RepID=UPI003D248123
GHIAGNNAADYVKLGVEAYKAQKTTIETKAEDSNKYEAKKEEVEVIEAKKIDNSKEKEELKKVLDNSKKTILVSLSDNLIIFDKNSDQIKNSSNDILDSIADYLSNNSKATIKVIGHTDSDGDRNYNKDLSQRRANNIKTYFINKGIDGTRITSIGHGENKPLVPNKGSANKAKNRRVDIEIKN